MDNNIPRILIAAAGSGSGKTTIVSGLLAALNSRGLNIIGYKVGPDYIDPEHHRRAGKCQIYNLDTWLTSREKVYELFNETARNHDISIVEGVMGLYDGGRHSLDSEKGGMSSSAEIAKLLKIPVILVINARSVGESAAAIALGFKEYDKEINLAGVILNNVGSDSHRDMIADGLKKVNIKLVGAIKRNSALTLPERHLGLLPAEELKKQNISEQAHIEAARLAVEEGINIEELLKIAASAPALDAPDEKTLRLTSFATSTQTVASRPERGGLKSPPLGEKSRSDREGHSCSAKKIKIAVARDEAFTFYYPDSLAYLEKLGAELIYFSPLKDLKLPDNINGVILGGGFPEMFAAELEKNISMRSDIAAKTRSGEIKILAECGGMMYLSEFITDFNNNKYEMIGLIPASCRMNDKLQTVGYVEAVPLRDTLLGTLASPLGEVANEVSRKGVLRGHEFHFSSMTPLCEDEKDFNYAFNFTRKRTGAVYPGGYADENITASYLHINFRGNSDAAEYFLSKLC